MPRAFSNNVIAAKCALAGAVSVLHYDRHISGENGVQSAAAAYMLFSPDANTGKTDALGMCNGLAGWYARSFPLGSSSSKATISFNLTMLLAGIIV